MQRSAPDLDQASLGSEACEERERGGGGGGLKGLAHFALQILVSAAKRRGVPLARKCNVNSWHRLSIATSRIWIHWHWQQCNLLFALLPPALATGITARRGSMRARTAHANNHRRTGRRGRQALGAGLDDTIRGFPVTRCVSLASFCQSLSAFSTKLWVLKKKEKKKSPLAFASPGGQEEACICFQRKPGLAVDLVGDGQKTDFHSLAAGKRLPWNGRRVGGGQKTPVHSSSPATRKRLELGWTFEVFRHPEWKTVWRGHIGFFGLVWSSNSVGRVQRTERIVRVHQWDHLSRCSISMDRLAVAASTVGPGGGCCVRWVFLFLRHQPHTLPQQADQLGCKDGLGWRTSSACHHRLQPKPIWKNENAPQSHHCEGSESCGMRGGAGCKFVLSECFCYHCWNNWRRN